MTREAAIAMGVVAAGTVLGLYMWNKGNTVQDTSSISTKTSHVKEQEDAANFKQTASPPPPYSSAVTAATATITTTTSMNDQESSSGFADNPQTPQESADEQSKKFADIASQHYNDKKFELAIEGFTQALALVPDNFRFYTNRAMAYLALRNYQKAFNDAQESVDLQSTAKGHYTLGRGAMGLKKYTKAIESFNAVLAFKERATTEYAEKSILKCYKGLAQELVNTHFKSMETHEDFKKRVGDFGNIPEHVVQRVWKKKHDSDLRKKRKEEEARLKEETASSHSEDQPDISNNSTSPTQRPVK